MSIAIVYTLEIHKVQKQYRQPPLLPSSLGNSMAQAVSKQVSIGKPSQCIVVGEMKKPSRPLSAFHFVSQIESSIEHHDHKRDNGRQQSQSQFPPANDAPAKLLLNAQNKGLTFAI